MLIKDKWIIGTNIWVVVRSESESSITFACYFGHDVRNWYGLYTILHQWFVTGHFFFPTAMNKWLCLKVYTKN